MNKRLEQSAHPPCPAPLWPDAGLEELLALAGQKYPLEFAPLSAGGVRLHILQVADMRERLDRAIADNALEDALNALPLWAKIWPASVILGHMLRHIPGRKHAILEIGAGCGVAGLVAAALGLGRVCISDINEDALLFARINILKNNLAHCAEVRRVDMRRDFLEERFSLILGAEILYLEHLYGPQVKFLKRHLARATPVPDPDEETGAVCRHAPAEASFFEPQALLAADHRRKAAPFFKRAEKEFRIRRQMVGAKESENSGLADARGERHLIGLYRLTFP